LKFKIPLKPLKRYQKAHPLKYLECLARSIGALGASWLSDKLPIDGGGVLVSLSPAPGLNLKSPHPTAMPDKASWAETVVGVKLTFNRSHHRQGVAGVAPDIHGFF